MGQCLHRALIIDISCIPQRDPPDSAAQYTQTPMPDQLPRAHHPQSSAHPSHRPCTDPASICTLPCTCHTPQTPAIDSLPHTMTRHNPLNMRSQGIRTSVEGLQTSMGRVQGEVTELCTRVRLLCTQASNLHAAADLLRAVLLRLKLVARLRACIPPGER